MAITQKEFKQYYNELEQVLLDQDIDKLTLFIEKWEKVYSKGYVERFKSASPLVKEITLHKLIVNYKKLPAHIRVNSRCWLTSRGYDLKIN